MPFGFFRLYFWASYPVIALAEVSGMPEDFALISINLFFSLSINNSLLARPLKAMLSGSLMTVGTLTEPRGSS